MATTRIWQLAALAIGLLICGRASAQVQEIRGEWTGSVPTFKIPATRAVPVLEIQKVLREVIETKPYHNEMPMSKFLAAFKAGLPKNGKDIGIILDMEGFFTALTEGDDVRKATVQLPPIPKTMTVHTALRLAISQLPVEAELHVRRGYLEITTPEKAAQSLESVVSPRIVSGALAQVLDDLAEDTGVNIVIDPRVQKQSETVVKAKFVRPIRLGAAVEMLSDMAGLRCVLVHDSLYVTSPANAKELQENLRDKRRENGNGK